MYALALLLLFGCHADAVLLLCHCILHVAKPNQLGVCIILVTGVIWTCQSLNMELLHEFVKVVKCSHPLPNKTKVKFDPDSEASLLAQRTKRIQ